MKLAGAILLFIVICGVSALTLLCSVPVVVHAVTPDLEQTLATLAVLLALAIAWWFASGRRWLLAAVGWLILAVPFTSHAVWQSSTLIADYRGAQLPARMEIENFVEAPIYWHGFDGPVGYTITFDLVHPAGLDGIVFTPQVRMAPAYDIAAEDLQSIRTFSGGYFHGRRIDPAIGDLTLLKPILFQGVYGDNTSDQDIDALDPSGRTHLTYHLHPGTIETLHSVDQICLTNPSFGLPTCGPTQDAGDGCVGKNTRKVTDVTYHIGQDLSALWTADGDGFRNADLGALISQTLQRRSSLQGKPEAWTALQRRLEPASLEAAGYRLCPRGPKSHSIGKACYCRP